MINWCANKEEILKIAEIANKAAALLGPGDKINLIMDIEACHCNGCKLDLDGLLNAKAGDLLHDVVGIANHINRENGKLEGCFLPRFAAKVPDLKVVH